MDIQKIRIKGDYKLADIVHDIEKGELRVPQFQREFVWDKKKVVKLLESIYSEYPIGSFFFWNAPPDYHNFYRDIAELNLPKPDKYDKITFILDGQQRITSLYVTVKGLKLYGRDYRDICFDLDEKVFVDKKSDNQQYVSISDLLSDDKPDIYDGLTTERKRAYKDCDRRFTNYPFSAIDVRDKKLDEVCEIFERINQGGQRLNLFDLVSASTWTPEFDLRQAVKAENENLKSKGFGEIDNEVYLQALALIARGSCTRPAQLQLQADDVNKFWRDTIESISLAIDYLRNNLGVVNSTFIPYRSMIALAAYLFFKCKARSLNHRQSELLTQWFWRAAFSERYTASILTLMTEDKRLMDKIAAGTSDGSKYPINLNIDSLIQIRMYQRSAIKNGVLCLLARRNPRHFKNNSILTLKDGYYSDFNSSEKHHVFPKSVVRKNYSLAMVHSLPNFCFIPAELNKEISNKKSSNYFEDFRQSNPDFEDTLKTHLIKYDDSVKRNNYKSFLASRAATILEEINRITGSKIGRVVADDANKAIDDTEKRLRDLTNDKMLAKNLNYWKNSVPSDIVGTVRQRVRDYLAKDPSKRFDDLDSRNLMDFCDIMDYSKIILSNWDAFAPIFRSKSETEKRFLNLKEFRNAVKHSRGEIVPFIQKEGEAALEWLSMIFREFEKTKNEKKSLSNPPEDDEETTARVKSEFVKRAVKLFPEWIEKEYPSGKLYIMRGKAGSHRSLKQRGGGLILFYYFASDWVYAELQLTTSEELKLLKDKLSKPESIIERHDRYSQVRFHIMNEDDFKIVQQIIKSRLKDG